MDYSQDHLTSRELGLSLGILIGIVVLQSTGNPFGLVILPVIGTGLGMWAACLIHSMHNWAEEG